jgi:predicted amidophosphoribosyltransferase
MECDGCLNAGDHTPATVSVETWDEGDGMITLNYCAQCNGALENICDRCGSEGENIEGFSICGKCLADYNRGDNF